MASTQRNSSQNTGSSRRRKPARSPEERENQIINMAYDEAELQIQEGRASAQVISHFLKLGSTRERLEQERLLREVDLLEKKAEGIESAKRMEALYEEAISAMRSYGGEEPHRDG